MADSSFFRQPKYMQFAWCRDGQHDRCRKAYGGDRILCDCDCDPEVHGTNYTPIHKAMSEDEINTSLASINAIMTGDAGDGVSKNHNRAVKETSSVWGDQVKSGANTYSYEADKDRTRYDYSKNWEEPDAKDLDELAKRRAAVSSVYDYSGFEAWI